MTTPKEPTMTTGQAKPPAPFTDADVELVRAAIRQAAYRAVGEPFHGERTLYDHYADAVLTALADAGRLLPDAGGDA